MRAYRPDCSSQSVTLSSSRKRENKKWRPGIKCKQTNERRHRSGTTQSGRSSSTHRTRCARALFKQTPGGRLSAQPERQQSSRLPPFLHPETRRAHVTLCRPFRAAQRDSATAAPPAPNRAGSLIKKPASLAKDSALFFDQYATPTPGSRVDTIRPSARRIRVQPPVVPSALRKGRTACSSSHPILPV